MTSELMLSPNLTIPWRLDADKGRGAIVDRTIDNVPYIAVQTIANGTNRA